MLPQSIGSIYHILYTCPFHSIVKDKIERQRMPIHTLPTAVTARRGLHDVEYDPPRILQSPYSALSPYGSWVTGSARIGAPSANVGAAAVGPAGKLSRTFSAIAGTSSRRGSSASGSGSAAATAATAGSASSASSSSLSRPWLRQPKTDERVRFAWSNEPDVMPRLRRFAQLVAIDTMGEKEGARTSKARFSAITGVLAWWEDEEGYWLVYTSDREDVEPLPVYWTEMYEGKGKGKGKEREGAGGGYCTECFCLLSVAEVMRVSSGRFPLVMCGRANGTKVIGATSKRAGTVVYEAQHIWYPRWTSGSPAI